MRKLIVTMAALGLVGIVQAAQVNQPDTKQPAKALKVGDPAPALKADKWLQGSEVKEFQKDKTYVVEFWATWCGPCIVMMPHMAEMQAEYRDKGVTFIGYSAKDPNNSLDKVSEFVKKRGPKLGYTFAYGDDRDTYDAWMKAAGQGGIPCSFVVDGTGKVAYIGHPMYLDLVLPKVVAGTWTEKDVAHLAEVEKDINGAFKLVSDALKPGGDADAAIKGMADLEAKHPFTAKVPYFVGPKLSLLLKVKRFDDAKKLGDDVVARATKQEDPQALAAVSSALRSAAKDHKDIGALSLKAAEGSLKFSGEKDLAALISVAETHFALGDLAKAKEFGAKALAAAPTPQAQQYVEKLMKKYNPDNNEK